MFAGQNLIRFGSRFSEKSTFGRLRLIIWFLSLSVVVVACGISALVFGSGQMLEQRAESLRPIEAQFPQEAKLWYHITFDYLGDTPVTIISLQPVSESAPLPPGLEYWPSPGNVALSQSLYKSLPPDSLGRFGQLNMILGSEGTETASELRVVRRVPLGVEPESIGMIPIMGFGGSQAAAFGYGAGSLYAADQVQILAVIAVTLLIPGLASIFVLSYATEDSVRRRQTILATLGSTRWQSVRLTIGEIAAPLTFALIVPLMTLGVMAVDGVTLPRLNYTLAAPDMLKLSPKIALGVVAGWFLAIFMLVIARELGRSFSRESLQGDIKPPPYRRAVTTVILIWLIVFVTSRSSLPLLRTGTYYLGSAVVATLLPSTIAVVVTLVGKSLSRSSRLTGSAILLMAGRRLEYIPHKISRLVSGIAIVILILGQSQLLGSALSSAYYRSLAERMQFGTRVVYAYVYPTDPGFQLFIDSISTNTIIAWPHEPNSTTNQGLDTAREIFFYCNETASLACNLDLYSAHSLPALSYVVQQTVDNTVPVFDSQEIIPINSEGLTLFLLSPTDDDLDVGALTRLSYEYLPLGIQFRAPGLDYAAFGARQHAWASWIITSASVGAGIMILTFAILLMGEIRETRSKAVKFILSKQSYCVKYTTINIAIPLTIASVIGCLAYFLLPQGLTFEGSFAEAAMYFQPSLAYKCCNVAHYYHNWCGRDN